MYRNILRCSTLFSHIFFVILMKDDDWSLGIILGLPTELKSGLLSKWLEGHVCCSRTRLRPLRARERLSWTQGFLCAGRAKVDKIFCGWPQGNSAGLQDGRSATSRSILRRLAETSSPKWQKLEWHQERLKRTERWKREQAEQSIREKLKIQMFIFNKRELFFQQSSASRWNSSDQMKTKGKENKNRLGRPTQDKFLLVFFWFQDRRFKRGHGIEEVQQP